MKFNKNMLFILFTMVLMLGCFSPLSAAEAPVKGLEITHLFDGKEGTMVLKNLKTEQTYVFNKERSLERMTPESTFKILNALIGLDTRAVRDEYEVKRWDGIVRQFEPWNRDHTLGSAMRESAIWFYQDMARNIGFSRMQEKISKLNYGNKDLSGEIDQFWLDSSLKISAIEQVDFMEQLVKEVLPFKKEHQKVVKRMMIQDEQDDYTLHGKTGTRLSDMGLGWFVGYVKTEKNVWVFAVNLNGSGSEAKNITIEALKEKEIIK